MAEKKEFALGDYIDVAERIQAFKAQYPEGSLQRVDLQFVEFGGKSWVVYTAAAYRTPDDERPGMGTAWEEVPGRTPYTRDSEAQNSETAAWGRAIVAVGLAASGRIASRQEAEASQARQALEQRLNALKVRVVARLGDSITDPKTEVPVLLAAFAAQNDLDPSDVETLQAFHDSLPPSEQEQQAAQQVAAATSGRTK